MEGGAVGQAQGYVPKQSSAIYPPTWPNLTPPITGTKTNTIVPLMTRERLSMTLTLIMGAVSRLRLGLLLNPNPPMGGVKAGQIGMREPTREKAWAPLGPM